MPVNFESIADRFRMGGVTPEQLEQYVNLKIITKKQANALIAERYQENGE